ncbi:ATP-binding protein (plasmid) [Klebsiella pneumoniae]|nr:ATP-binding protein [Klebsiella pneumoniae]
MRKIDAQYHQAALPEYKGNPLIEALPVWSADKDIVNALACYPSVTGEEKILAPNIRTEYLLRLKELRQPLPVYIDCFRAIETAIKEGYSCKNPLSPTTVNYLHYPVTRRPNIQPSSGFLSPKGCGITVIGESGVGKTCMLEQILNWYPDVIVHTGSDKHPVFLRQVVWLKVDCPTDSSVKALCYRILTGLDEKLGAVSIKKPSTIPQLLEQIEARIKSSFLGILVIDEMQNMNLAKSGGAERLLSFIHSLVNNLGIPVLFCANPPFNELLSESLKAARRAESYGYFELSLLKNDDVWSLFIDELWLLQWTNVYTPLTRELSDTLFELSVGNIELAVRVFREAQRLIIGRENEAITDDLLRYSAENVIRLSLRAVNAISCEHNMSILKRQSDVISQTSVLEHDELPHQNMKYGDDFLSIPGALNIPQHPEFFSKLIKLQQYDRRDQLILDTDLYQRVVAGTDTVTQLRENGYYCCSLLPRT